jgi:ankyrin repeat protein
MHAIDFSVLQDIDGNTPLMAAAKSSCSGAVEKLLAAIPDDLIRGTKSV